MVLKGRLKLEKVWERGGETKGSSLFSFFILPNQSKCGVSGSRPTICTSARPREKWGDAPMGVSSGREFSGTLQHPRIIRRGKLLVQRSEREGTTTG